MSEHDAEWEAFLKGHRQELEDALLPTLAQAQTAGVIADPAKQLVQVRQVAESKGVTVEYPDGEPAPGTPMKMVTFYGKGGEQVQVPMPAKPGPKGIRVRINGIDGVLFDESAPFDQDADEEVEEAITVALDVHARQVGHDGVLGIYGLAVPDSLRDELVDAWDNHYLDHGCQAAAMMLDRIIEQLIQAFRREQA